jgi:hypothetical protein
VTPGGTQRRSGARRLHSSSPSLPCRRRRTERRRLAAFALTLLLGAAGGSLAPSDADAQTSTNRQQPGPYDIALFTTAQAPKAKGKARLVSAESPFGIAVTADGRARYDFHIDVAGLPDPSTLGAYEAYVAWAVSPDLSKWTRLGTVRNGTSTVGTADLDKFLLVITAEASAEPEEHAGPTVLHGTSPSGWLQSFLSHPLFRGVY